MNTTQPISETVSKKRGRPEAFPPGVVKIAREMFPDLTTRRGLLAKCYEITAVQSLTEDGHVVEGVKRILDPNGRAYCATVLEHLGRLSAENPFDDELIRDFARRVNDYIVEGHAVREAVRVLRLIRNHYRNGGAEHA